MQQVLVGNSGLRSSRLALGTMGFGDRRPWGCTTNEAECIMSRFVAEGGTTLDTAPNYADGASEEIVGKFASSRRDELVLTTKYTGSPSSHPLAGGNSRRSMVQSVEASLRRLQTDRIDLLWLHFWDGTTPLDEILRAADDLVSAGKIIYFGLSDTPAWLSARAVTMARERRLAPVIALQLEYNAATRGVERDLLPMAEALDLGVFCWGPLAAGALADGEAPRRTSEARLSPALREVRDGLRALSAQSGHAPRKLALQWLVHGAGTSCIPILGARSADQLAVSIDDLAVPLPNDVLAAVDALASRGTLFPAELIGTSYLRKFALGTPDLFTAPRPPRC